MIDTISSLVSFDFRMDEWGVDVAIGGSQKGLMLPAGLSFNGISRKALAATQSARCARSYWDWRNLLTDGRQTAFARSEERRGGKEWGSTCRSRGSPQH